MGVTGSSLHVVVLRVLVGGQNSICNSVKVTTDKERLACPPGRTLKRMNPRYQEADWTCCGDTTWSPPSDGSSEQHHPAALNDLLYQHSMDGSTRSSVTKKTSATRHEKGTCPLYPILPNTNFSGDRKHCWHNAERFRFRWNDLEEVFAVNGSCPDPDERYHLSEHFRLTHDSFPASNPSDGATFLMKCVAGGSVNGGETQANHYGCTCQSMTPSPWVHGQFIGQLGMQEVRNERLPHLSKPRGQRTTTHFEDTMTADCTTRSRRRRKAQKPREKPNQCLHLWEFLRDALGNPTISPGCITWTNQATGEFRIVKTAAMASLWGQSKNRQRMTYEKMARAMRYYYKLKILERVPGKRLHFRFSGNILSKMAL